MAKKKLANRFSTSFGNPFHGVSIDTRRDLNFKKDTKKVINGNHRK